MFGQDCRSVNFLAAHDGFTLADTVAYAERHNHANGEQNRDGHGENFSWNNGAEGPSDDPLIGARRAIDLRALLGTLFASTGTILLAAGDEFGRSQAGNNNAYAQDNPLSWIAWHERDEGLENHVAALAEWRARRRPWFEGFPGDHEWSDLAGEAITTAKWDDPATAGFCLRSLAPARRYVVEVDRGERVVTII